MAQDPPSQKRQWPAAVPYLALLVFLLLLVVIPNIFEPVVRDDVGRNIDIPKNLLHTMRVKAAYNDETLFFRFALPTEEPAWYHDYWIYRGHGEWQRQGRSPAGREPERIYEDRITFFLDDGGVPEFGKWGGFVTVSGPQMRFFSNEARDGEVGRIPRFDGQADVRKWLPETRSDPQDWTSVKPDEELEALQRAGYFLDLWHWRAHRSNPIGWSDDQYILDYRWSDAGRGAYTTNWEDQHGRPMYMFDPEKTGQHAMRWERVQRQEYGQDDYLRYALILGNDEIDGNAVPFDAAHDWQPGDVIPRRLLRMPEGARGAIRANGIYRDGAWHVDLWRAKDTGSPLHDKAVTHGGLYQIAFAAHIRATGSRWHYVSFPLTLGLGRDADIQAGRFSGAVPPWDDIEWFELKLFYPGQIDWSHLISDAHAGAKNIARGEPVRIGHREETLAEYAVQAEFRREIRSQWRQTVIALATLVILAAISVFILAPRPPQGVDAS
jgi:hypothetical protein